MLARNQISKLVQISKRCVGKRRKKRKEEKGRPMPTLSCPPCMMVLILTTTNYSRIYGRPAGPNGGGGRGVKLNDE